MASVGSDLENVLVGDREHWLQGPPHALFKQMRRECPVHFSEQISEYPEEDGYWSVTTADDIHAVSRDWQTYSSELGGITAVSRDFPIERRRALLLGMDPPKHASVTALFQAGCTPGPTSGHVGPTSA